MTDTSTRFSVHVLTLAAAAAVAVAWILLILSESGTAPFGRGGYRLNAVVPSSALLAEGSRVTMGGAEVGSVVKVDRSNKPGRLGTHVEMRITDKRVTPVPVDSKIQIRTRSQVGENYVSIAVGRGDETFASGSYMPAKDNKELVEVDQILSVVNGRTKDRARKLLAGLGGALDGRSDELSQTLQGTTRFVDGASTTTGILYRDRTVVAQLVDQLGRIATEVGGRGSAIDTIADRGLTSLRAVGDRDAALAATLRELPGTLDQIRETSDTVGRVTPQAAPVVNDLTSATADLEPVVDLLGPASRTGTTVLRNLAGAAPPLEDTLEAVTRLSDPLPKALPELRTALCQVNPALRYILPYKVDLFSIVTGLGSASNSYDATGHLARLAPVMSASSVSGLPPAVTKARRTLLESGLFGISNAISYDPYVKPGEVGSTEANAKGFPRGPEQLAKSGYKYPRVTADC